MCADKEETSGRWDEVWKWIDPEVTHIHGRQSLPAGYRYAYVPHDAEFETLQVSAGCSPIREHLASSYSIPKAVIAIFQTVYAAITLYQSRGDQIGIFGWAAYGLTVTPYLMSIANFLAQIVTPDYDSFFLVASDVSDEAERRGGKFVGTVARLARPEISESFLHYTGTFLDEPGADERWSQMLFGIQGGNDDRALQISSLRRLPIERVERSGLLDPKCIWVPAYAVRRLGPSQTNERLNIEMFFIIFSPLAFLGLVLLIVGVLSGFHANESTTAQRAWIMSWLITGHLQGFIVLSFLQAGGPLHTRWRAYLETRDGGAVVKQTVFWGIIIVGLFVPAIGGFVVVGQELKQHGVCSKN